MEKETNVMEEWAEIVWLLELAQYIKGPFI
jgi:hypothetical protein